jgi:uncharacterized protein involved in type VI secretion and phage assembly
VPLAVARASGDSRLVPDDTSLPPYELQIDGFPARHFRVHGFTGKEALSEAWSFDVTATAEVGGDLVEQRALAARATLLFHVGPEPRAFYGIVSAVRVVQAHHADHTVKLRLRVVPRLWLLKRKQRTRIFQKLRVPDIVTAVLLEAGITTRWQLTRAYPEREYVTQYEETDYAFVKRLLAEAGIFFSFFGGGPIDDAALTADAALGAVASVGESVVGEFAGQAVGGLVGSAVSMAETLIPGDTVMCADDAACYAPVAGDDPAALAASTAAALAPAVGDALGAGDGIAGAAIGAASAVAGTVIAEATEGGKSAPVLRFLENEDAKVTAYDKVRSFVLENTVRSSAAAFREFDPDRPAVRLQSKAVSSAPFPPSPFEEAAMAIAAAENVAGTVEALVPLPGAVEGVINAVEDVADQADALANQIGAAFGQRVPFEVYEHHSPFLFPKWAFGGDEAPKILRQKRRRASIATGEGGCSDFSPGHRFELREHPVGQLDGAYVVTSVRHRGETHPGEGGGGRWRVYENRFECAPASMPYVPARPKRKSVQVALTATVVGPPGEEIHVDEKGQIKVQFHWDRDGKYDGQSSCWIRVMQPWAGAAWGHQFIPRVGMEVVVTFEGGDPDKPMVLGSVYNGTHPMPFKLPEQKTMSGIRTSTYPGGRGYNELSFNDARGAEQILIRAQLDMDEVVERHHKVHVGASQTQTVRGKQIESIEQDQILTVAADRIEGVGHDLKSRVGNDRTATVGRDDAVVVGGDAKATVSGHYALEVRHGYSVTVGSDQEPAQSDHYINGSGSLGASDRLILRAEKGIVLQCGDTVVELTPEGLDLFGKSIKATGAGISLSGDGPTMEMGKDLQVFSKSIAMHSEKSTLSLGETAEIKGDKIQLKSNQTPPAPQSKDDDAEKKPFSCQFSDYYLRPYANKTFHLRAEGLKIEGSTDGEGMVKAKIPKDTKQIVVTIWIDDYPTGRRKTYTLSQATIPPASSVEGALVRLKHLGYFSGDPGDELTSTAQAAILWFQEDHKDSHALEATGELDGPTQGALVDVYGS